MTAFIRAVGLCSATAIAAVTATSAIAHGDNEFQMFASPSGHIHCHIDAAIAPPNAQCQILHYTYDIAPNTPVDFDGTPCPESARGGGFFRLDQGEPAYLTCAYANLESGFSGVWPILDYGQTRSLGSLTCSSEQEGVTCTDSSTGHFFRVSRDSYQLG